MDYTLVDAQIETEKSGEHASLLKAYADKLATGTDKKEEKKNA